MPYNKSFIDQASSVKMAVTRDIYTCMRAQTENQKISSKDFITVAKMVCRKIPQLKDQEPVGLKFPGDFAYHVSSCTY